MKLDEAQSVCSMLDYWAKVSPNKIAVRFLADGESETSVHTFANLRDRSYSIAHHLFSEANTGDRIILLYEQGPEFIAAYMGCLLAGMIAVPVAPPSGRADINRIKGILNNAQPSIILTDHHMKEHLNSTDLRIESGDSVRVISSDLEISELAVDFSSTAISTDLAFLQYTSGSTGSPKGVMVTHGNLLANADMIRDGLRYHTESELVTWLPHFHDMGLIGGVLIPIFMGCSMTLMPPLAFLRKPSLWLKAMTKYKATVAGGPNFAFDLCVKKTDDATRNSLDLSTLDVLYNGAEPVKKETLERFTKAFSCVGFREGAFLPCYGMAESTLIISGRKKRDDVYKFDVDAAVLETENRATPPSSLGVQKSLIGCGMSIGQSRVVIVDPESKKPCPDGEVGEVWAAGPHIAQGYWNNHAVSQTVFYGRVNASDKILQELRFLKTGDLGYLMNEQLVICGRIKDLIISAGRNIYPQDIEAKVASLSNKIRTGCVAAFQNEVDSGISVIAEWTEATADQEAELLCKKVQTEIGKAFQLAVTQVALVEKGSVPKTTSGKIQRKLAAKLLRTNSLPVLSKAGVRSTNNASEKPAVKNSQPFASPPRRIQRDQLGIDTKVSQASVPPKPVSTKRLGSQPVPIDYESVQSHIKTWLAETLGIEAAQISEETRFADYGLDSVAAVDLQIAVKNRFQIEVSDRAMFDYDNIDSLAKHVIDIQNKLSPTG